jgi:hypothetical protein
MDNQPHVGVCVCGSYTMLFSFWYPPEVVTPNVQWYCRCCWDLAERLDKNQLTPEQVARLRRVRS